MMSAPAAPTPEVERKAKVEVVSVPPITKGTVAEVVIVGVTKVGLVAKTKAPEPVSSLNWPEMPDDRVVAVNALVPLPISRPVKVVVPVLPTPTDNVPEIPAEVC